MTCPLNHILAAAAHTYTPYPYTAAVMQLETTGSGQRRTPAGSTFLKASTSLGHAITRPLRSTWRRIKEWKGGKTTEMLGEVSPIADAWYVLECMHGRLCMAHLHVQPSFFAHTCNISASTYSSTPNA